VTNPNPCADAGSKPLCPVVTFSGEMVVSVLARARELIRHRRDWIHDAPGETACGRATGEPALVRHYAARRSLLGAVEAATADIDLQRLCTHLLERAVNDTIDGYLSLQHLAYYEGHDAALGALTDAIELARGGDHPVVLGEEFLEWHRPPTEDEYLDLCGELQGIEMWFTRSDRYSGMFNGTPSMRRQAADRERAIEAYLADHKDRLPTETAAQAAEGEFAGMSADSDDVPF